VPGPSGIYRHISALTPYCLGAWVTQAAGTTKHAARLQLDVHETAVVGWPRDHCSKSADYRIVSRSVIFLRLGIAVVACAACKQEESRAHSSLIEAPLTLRVEAPLH
jgi:hypothetical protein